MTIAAVVLSVYRYDLAYLSQGDGCLAGGALQSDNTLNFRLLDNFKWNLPPFKFELYSF